MDDRPDPPLPPGQAPEPADLPSTAEHPVLEQLERAGRDARWHMSRHTLELAIQAIESPEDAAAPPKRSAKGKRRRRRKRLL